MAHSYIPLPNVTNKEHTSTKLTMDVSQKVSEIHKGVLFCLFHLRQVRVPFAWLLPLVKAKNGTANSNLFYLPVDKEIIHSRRKTDHQPEFNNIEISFYF